MQPNTNQNPRVITDDGYRTQRSVPPALKGGILVAGILAMVLLFSYDPTGSGSEQPMVSPPPIIQQAEEEPPISDPWFVWSRVDIDTSHPYLESLVATESGFAFLANPAPAQSGTRLWFSADGTDWSSTLVQASLFGLVPDGDGLVGFGGRSATYLSQPEWAPTRSTSLPGWITTGYGSGRSGLAVGAGGIVVQTLARDIFMSTEGSIFESVDELLLPAAQSLPEGECRPPNAGSPDLLPLVATDNGFVTLIPTKNDLPYDTWPVCEPRAWMTDAVGTWTPVTDANPFGPGAFVYDLSWHDGRLVAVGGVDPNSPVVWESTDAAVWQAAPLATPLPEVEYELRNVESGPAGWIVLGSAAEPRRSLGWVSTDASCWHPVPEAVSGRMAAVGSDRIVVADRIGQQTVLWVGVPTALSRDGVTDTAGCATVGSRRTPGF